jgi:hypothetical protein
MFRVWTFAAWTLIAACSPPFAVPQEPSLNIERNETRLEFRSGKQRFAEYVFGDAKTRRPFFANVLTPSGLPVTRTHPPISGKDATDHDTMHPGIWLAFGDVCGEDFWRNKGAIKHVHFTEQPAASNDSITFATECLLETAAGKPLATMKNRLQVKRRPSGWLFIWDVTFHADRGDIAFGDQEEMGFGARVATPITEKASGALTNSMGKKTAKETWGKPSAWCDYSGRIDDKSAGILLMTSPKNFRNSWWHSRDYGVFVANPFGRAAMRQGAPSSVVVKKGEMLRLVFGAVAHEGNDVDLSKEFDAFVKESDRQPLRER